ncbi:DUF3043 domain-containing protein [Planotetraspora sp. A-T 1434]|uniref:DUF3043 domain-containing protein n=1 Tax=Planotetraspora sp. A-T 1434 TaxID=2979219 RepID=UPI0021C1C0AD|nr:DUF3043 domain-containing protein [Planotetraspora sp. A-T 1434]MCT9930074.1 DUF3043 domain-containing protein [Planotetraspora sp. A-T 1434]
MFRRRSQTPTADSPVPVDDPKPQGTPGKGRPTPKRSEAQGRRRSPVTAPTNRKEAYRLQRERDRATRVRQREGMLRGDERYLQPRDRGPARKFARDWVDSRRLPGQYFLPAVFVIMLVSMVPFPVPVRSVVLLVYTLSLPVVMVLVLVSSFYVAGRVRKEVAEKFPDESLKGIGFYAAMRSSQIRRLRFPKPTVLPGGKPVPSKS